MDDVTIARAIHVLSVIHWIGGLAFVTLIVLPLARAKVPPLDKVLLFEGVERRFSVQVRLSVPLAGVSGFWMVERMDLWSRFADLHYWWLTAMTGLWALFMLILFIVEPLLHEHFEREARANPDAVLGGIARVHYLLLAFAATTAAGAVAGSHGLFF